jgi:hypothetical protein
MSAANNASKKLVNEKLSVRHLNATASFKKKGYLIPKGCSKTLIADAFMAIKNGASLYFPMIKDVKKEAQDYTVTHGGHYSITQEAANTYNRKFANVSMSTVRLITEMVTIEKSGKNLWCEGSSVDPHYYLLVLSVLANDVYQRFKQDTKEVVEFIGGTKFDKWVKGESDLISKEARNQVGTIMNLISVNSKRTKLVEEMQASHRFIESQLSSYLTSTEQNDKLNTFLKAAHSISEGHAMLKTCPDSDERFRLFEKEFPDLMKEYNEKTGNRTLEMVATYATENEGCDLNDELLASLTSVMTSDKFNTSRKFDTVLPASLAHPFYRTNLNAMHEEEPSRLERVRKIAKKLHGTDKQLDESDLRDFVAEGWMFAGNKLVNYANGYQSVAAANLRVVLRSAYAIRLQSCAYDRTEVQNVTDSTKFFKSLGSNVAYDISVANAANSSKDLVNTLVNQAYISKSTDSVDSAILAAITGLITVCRKVAIAKCASAKALYTIRSMEHNLIPSFKALNAMFTRAYNKEFCNSEVYRSFISKNNDGIMHKINGILMSSVRSEAMHIFNDRKRRFEHIGNTLLLLIFKEHEDFSMRPTNLEYLKSPAMQELARHMETCRKNVGNLDKDAVAALSTAYEEIKSLNLSPNFELTMKDNDSVSAGAMSQASAMANENMKNFAQISKESKKLAEHFQKMDQEDVLSKLGDDYSVEVNDGTSKAPNTAPPKPSRKTAAPVRKTPIASGSGDVTSIRHLYVATGSLNDTPSMFDGLRPNQPRSEKGAGKKMDLESINEPQKLTRGGSQTYPLDQFIAASKNYLDDKLQNDMKFFTEFFSNDLSMVNATFPLLHSMMDNPCGDIDTVFTDPLKSEEMVYELLVCYAAPAIINVRIHRDRSKMMQNMMNGMFLSPLTMTLFLCIEAVLRDTANAANEIADAFFNTQTQEAFETYRSKYGALLQVLTKCFAALKEIRESKTVTDYVFDDIARLFRAVADYSSLYSSILLGAKYIASPLVLLLMIGDFARSHRVITRHTPAMGTGFKYNKEKAALRDLYNSDPAKNKFVDIIISGLDDIMMSQYFKLISWTEMFRNIAEIRIFGGYQEAYKESFSLKGIDSKDCKCICLISSKLITLLAGCSINSKQLNEGFVDWVEATFVSLV